MLRSARHAFSWIFFDGDVDPEWAENLNSVLDDNRLLTLPSGERLQVPSNVRIMMETETLRYDTLATVSRCGMIWFNDSLLSSNVLLKHELQVLRTLPQGVGTEGSARPGERAVDSWSLVVDSLVLLVIYY